MPELITLLSMNQWLNCKYLNGLRLWKRSNHFIRDENESLDIAEQIGRQRDNLPQPVYAGFVHE